MSDMEASVSAKSEVKNLYQLRLAQEFSFVNDQETYEAVRKAIRKFLFQELRQEVARVEEEKGYTAQTYKDLLDGKLIIK